MFDHEFGQTRDPGASAGSGRAARLWDALTRAAYGLDESRPVPPLDGRQLAQVIAQHAPERAYYIDVERAFAALAATCTTTTRPMPSRCAAVYPS